MKGSCSSALSASPPTMVSLVATVTKPKMDALPLTCSTIEAVPSANHSFVSSNTI